MHIYKQRDEWVNEIRKAIENATEVEEDFIALALRQSFKNLLSDVDAPTVP